MLSTFYKKYFNTVNLSIIKKPIRDVHKFSLMKKFILFSILGMLFTLNLFSQGTISGSIIDAEFGDGLIGANVVIEGTTTGVSTDFEGKYQLKTAAGTYTIVVSYLGYSDKKIEGVEVKEGEITYLDVTMSEGGVELDLDIVVVEKMIERSENAVLLLQKKSDKIQDGISSQEMAKLAVSDAAGAMKKVTGATVSGGKYIYIRGLGDRYSLTQLNGLVIPSSDPYRNGAQLDLIPSNLLDNIITSKIFTPDQPGTFTGGAVNIKTKSFPEQFSLTFSTSAGYNKQNNFNDGFLTHEGGRTDYWGYDDGTRARSEVLDRPDVLRSFEVESNLPVLTRVNWQDEGAALAQAADAAINAVSTQFTPTETTSSFDHGYGVTFGNQYAFGKNALGVIASASFKKRFQHLADYTRRNWNLRDINSGDLFNEGDFQETLSNESSTLNGMVGLSYKINNLHSISLSTIYNHSTDKTSRFISGERPDNIVLPDIVEGRELFFREREMKNIQVGGSHAIPAANNLLVEWKWSRALSSMIDPDRRFFENEFNTESNIYRIPASNVQRPFHFYRDLADEQTDYKIDVTLPLKNNFKLKVGGLYTDKSRDFTEFRYQVEENTRDAAPYAGNTDDYLSDGNVGIIDEFEPLGGFILGNYLLDRTEDKNQYTGTDQVMAGYLMATLPITKDLKFVGGARVEKTDIFVESADTSEIAGTIDQIDVLPSANFIYSLNDNMNLRASYSTTIARPNMREIAPFESFDPLTKTIYIGNPTLNRTKVQNFDLRWEWFLKPGELIAVSGYYKDFTDAITLFRLREPGNVFQYKNVENANLYGVEIELRKSLESLAPALKNFKFSTNLSLIKSNSDVPDEDNLGLDPLSRPFEGQANYILNTSLLYTNVDMGLDASLSLNTTGDKLAIISNEGNPDIYDRGRSQLDFSVSKRFNNLSLRLSAKNLLDSPYRQSSEYQGDEYIYYEFKRGITYSLGVSYTIR